jgi:hypothetical protein
MIELSEKRLKELANEKDEFCSSCGHILVCSIVGAETRIFRKDEDESTVNVGTAFDRETGRRQYLKNYTCPNYNTRDKRNDHDNYYNNQIIVI